MAEIDVSQEWRDLQELYRGMSEEELEAIATTGYELTDIAKQALHSEIARRHLKVNVRLEPPNPEDVEAPGDPEFDPATLDLVSAFGVETREQAEWVKQTLNEAGVPCYFGPDLLEDIEQLEFLPEHTVQVRVLRNDANRLQPVLKSFRERFPSSDDSQPGNLEVHCPRCRSTEVVFEGFGSSTPQGGKPVDDGEEDDDAAEDSAEPEDVEQVRAADPHAKFHWRCDHCGHQWQDEGLES